MRVAQVTRSGSAGLPVRPGSLVAAGLAVNVFVRIVPSVSVTVTFCVPACAGAPNFEAEQPGPSTGAGVQQTVRALVPPRGAT